MDVNIKESSYFWQGNKVKIRLLKNEDWKVYFEEQTDSEGFRVYEPGIPLPKTEEMFKELIENRIKNPSSSSITFMIENLNEEVVGITSICDRDEKNGTFSFSMRIFPKHRKKGYALEASKIVLKYGFYELRYQKANSETIEINTASINLHHALGFKDEGRRRRNVYTNGRYYDEVLFGMTIEEFKYLHNNWRC